MSLSRSLAFFHALLVWVITPLQSCPPHWGSPSSPTHPKPPHSPQPSRFHSPPHTFTKTERALSSQICLACSLVWPQFNPIILFTTKQWMIHKPLILILYQHDTITGNTSSTMPSVSHLYLYFHVKIAIFLKTETCRYIILFIIFIFQKFSGCFTCWLSCGRSSCSSSWFSEFSISESSRCLRSNSPFTVSSLASVACRRPADCFIGLCVSVVAWLTRLSASTDCW